MPHQMQGNSLENLPFWGRVSGTGKRHQKLIAPKNSSLKHRNNAKLNFTKYLISYLFSRNSSLKNEVQFGLNSQSCFENFFLSRSQYDRLCIVCKVTFCLIKNIKMIVKNVIILNFELGKSFLMQGNSFQNLGQIFTPAL